jgi:hypothetical protein
MNKKAFILFAAVLLALLFSCSGDTVSGDNPSPIEKAAKLNITVQDIITGKMLDSALVTLQSTGKTKSTSENGVALFEGVQVGEHSITAKKEGYASMRSGVTIGEYKSEGVIIARDGSSSFQLYPLTASLEGALFYTDSEGKYGPMPGMPIRIQLSDALGNSFMPQTIDTVTNADGKYFFDSLPAGASYTLYALGTTIGSMVYNSVNLQSAAPLIPGGFRNPNKNYDSYASTETIFILTKYPQTLTEKQAGDTLKFEFSEKIDKKSITSSTVKVISLNTGAEIAVNVIWGESDVKVVPASKLTENINVKFNGLKSISGKSLEQPSGGYNITVRKADLSKEKVSGLEVLKLDSVKYWTETVDLRWGILEGATEYEVYIREQESASYKPAQCGSYNIGEEYVTAKNCRVNSATDNARNGYAIKSKTSTFIVRAFNDDFKSTMNEADSVKVFDHSLPDFTNSNIYIQDNNEYWNNYSRHTTTDTIVYPYDIPNGSFINEANFRNFYDLDGKLMQKVGAVVDTNLRLFFNRPMDMTKELTITCSKKEYGDVDICDKLVLEYEWSDDLNQTRDMNLKLKVITKTTENLPEPGNLDVVFTIKGLESKEGVKFTTKYGKKESNNVNIRFVANTDPCVSNPFSAGCECADPGTHFANLGECCRIEYNFNNNSVCQAYGKNPCESGVFGYPSSECSNWCSTSTNTASSFCDDFCRANYDFNTSCRDNRNACTFMGAGHYLCTQYCGANESNAMSSNCDEYCDGDITNYNYNSLYCRYRETYCTAFPNQAGCPDFCASHPGANGLNTDPGYTYIHGSPNYTCAGGGATDCSNTSEWDISECSCSEDGAENSYAICDGDGQGGSYCSVFAWKEPGCPNYCEASSSWGNASIPDCDEDALEAACTEGDPSKVSYGSCLDYDFEDLFCAMNPLDSGCQ